MSARPGLLLLCGLGIFSGRGGAFQPAPRVPASRALRMAAGEGAWARRTRGALLGAALGAGLMTGPVPEAAAISASEVTGVLEKVRTAENVDALSVALDQLSDVTGDGEGLLPFSTKKEVVRGLKDKARNSDFSWDNDAVAAYSRIYFKLDPFYVVELRPWLEFGPFFGGLLYLVTLFVQQRLPDSFEYAYLGAVVAFVLPIIVLLNV